MNERVIATHIITALLVEKKSLATLLPKYLNPIDSAQQKAFIQEICYGVCRWYFKLDFIAKKLLTKPIKQKDQAIYSVILIGLYQLIYMNIPQHAAISETVQVTKQLKKSSTATLVNAILRHFLRQKEKLLKQAEKNEEAYYAHPKWLLGKLKKYWPNDWQVIVKTNNERAPLSLRVNRLKITTKDYLQKLSDQKIQAKTSADHPECIILSKPCDVSKLPGFSSGEVSVQDCGAQLAAHLLDLKPGQIVLDACAAPGGKTTHILETEPNLKQLIALDHDEHRLKRVKENLDRLSLKATLICADAAKPNSWHHDEFFDRILLDAPCSATGVIRRHPDIKLLRQPDDILSLGKKQLELLKALWPLLKPNGMLLYITCSVLPDENEKILDEFLKDMPDANIKPIDTLLGISLKQGKQILPTEISDGFYYAALTKK